MMSASASLSPSNDKDNDVSVAGSFDMKDMFGEQSDCDSEALDSGSSSNSGDEATEQMISNLDNLMTEAQSILQEGRGVVWERDDDDAQGDDVHNEE